MSSPPYFTPLPNRTGDPRRPIPLEPHIVVWSEVADALRTLADAAEIMAHHASRRPKPTRVRRRDPTIPLKPGVRGAAPPTAQEPEPKPNPEPTGA